MQHDPVVIEAYLGGVLV
ncbi:MAG: hypothetical protein ACREUV_10880 [Burkholderiales bacterium]